MTSKIFRSTMLVVAVVLLSTLAVIIGIAHNYFDGVQADQLEDELLLAATGTRQQGIGYLENVESEQFRLTWIGADGTVLYDTRADHAAMENHADREEIREALEKGIGSSTRHSATLMEMTVYRAVKLADGTVLRISMRNSTTATLILGILQPLCVIILIAIVLAAVLSHRMAKRIVEPLNRLDLERPLENDTYEELSPLLRRINRQHNQIAAQLESMRRKADEFNQITGNMREGLVVLDSEGVILSINPTAKALFDARDDSVGKSLLSVDRSSQLRDAVNAALDCGQGTALIEKNSKEYRLDLSRIQSDGKTIGAVVLAFDVTEGRNAERNRREFSANVSHELKTPLQSIMGSAELLENGLVKPEDTARFVGHIHKEAARLLNLVEDIIRLSQLDEGVRIPEEEVELLALCREVASSLQNTAREKDVVLEVSGKNIAVSGVRRLLYEIVYNLCDNAIKYNLPNGSVRVSVDREGEKTVLTVADTGIGIPAAHQERVFERFYRVDKSHSKLSGGTGLGLSIVKHAAAYHNAKLELQSTPGKGTTIQVIF